MYLLISNSISITGCLRDTSELNDITNANSSDEPNNNAENEVIDGNEGNRTGLEPTTSGPIECVFIVDTDNNEIHKMNYDHYIIVENNGGVTREFSIQIEHDGERVFDTSYELTANTALEIAMNDLGIYRTIIESESSRTVTTTKVSDDCNSRTTVSFGEEGKISTYNEKYC